MGLILSSDQHISGYPQLVSSCMSVTTLNTIIVGYFVIKEIGIRPVCVFVLGRGGCETSMVIIIIIMCQLD